jgi:glutathione S-transferase
VIVRGVGTARFFLLTGRNAELIEPRCAYGEKGLDLLEAHLTGRDFLVGDPPSIADISVFAYTHVAPDAGIDLGPRTAVRGRIERIEALPGFVDDYVRYPDNARPSHGRSIYDAA